MVETSVVELKCCGTVILMPVLGFCLADSEAKTLRTEASTRSGGF